MVYVVGTVTVGAVKTPPLTPVPEKVPKLPARLVGSLATGAGRAERVRVAPEHNALFEEVKDKLLFCLTETLMEDEPPGKQ